MKQLVSVLLLAALLLPLFPVIAEEAPAASGYGFGIDEATFKTIDAMIEKALAAYNAQDYKAFYADFAKMMAAICTDQAFDTLYKGQYHGTYGAYKSRTYKADASTLAEDTGLFTYEGEFEKGKALIQVNITKEEGALKIMQLAFTPIP